MLTKFQRNRLLVLRELVLENAYRYNHAAFSDGTNMCALGMAVHFKEQYFPGLQFHFWGYSLVTEDGSSVHQEADRYFGDYSWKNIFSSLSVQSEEDEYPTAIEIAKSITRFIETQGVENA